MKELSEQGLGIKHKQADYISEDDENKLWDSGAISLDTAQGLLNGVFLYSCKTFGLRAFDEHRALTPDQFVVGYDTEIYQEELTYYDKVCKNNPGGIKIRDIKQKVVEQYSEPENPRCIVKLFKTYLEYIPKEGAFYRKAMKFTQSSTPRFLIMI